MNSKQTNKLYRRLENLQGCTDTIETARRLNVPLTELGSLVVSLSKEIEATEAYIECLIDSEPDCANTALVYRVSTTCSSARTLVNQVLFGDSNASFGYQDLAGRSTVRNRTTPQDSD